jgi:hypothetical protein
MNLKSMLPGDDAPLSGEVRDLLHSYRDSFPEAPASADFMPGLWARIDARRTITYSFGRLARGYVTASLLLCIVLTGTLFRITRPSPSSSHTSYIDVLVDDSHTDDDFELQLASAENI